jgi:hypothetical protein
VSVVDVDPFLPVLAVNDNAGSERFILDENVDLPVDLREGPGDGSVMLHCRAGLELFVDPGRQLLKVEPRLVGYRCPARHYSIQAARTTSASSAGPALRRRSGRTVRAEDYCFGTMRKGPRAEPSAIALREFRHCAGCLASGLP